MVGDSMRTKVAARRVLLIGTDGLRPDLFDAELMPTYASVMSRGTELSAHHAVFPSLTRAILSTIVTGCTPGSHGIVSSTMRIDDIAPDHIMHTDNVDHFTTLDRMTGGRAIMRPTLGDILERHNVRMGIAGAQTSGGGAIWARNQQFPKIVTSTTYQRPENQELWDRLGGDPPSMDSPNRNPHNEYAARGVADIFLDDASLRLIVLWFAEPDYSLHKHGLGSPEVQDALRVCDESLAYVLEAIDKRGLQDNFNIMLISDHGHSTVKHYGGLDEQLARAADYLGDRMPAVSFASNNLYPVLGAQPPTASELLPLVEWLQTQPWAGAVFGGTMEISRLPGVIPLADLWNGYTNERVPLLALSSSWSHDSNAFGVAGSVNAPIRVGGTASTHGSASPYDMHAVAYMVGPDFLEGTESTIPSGATDLAPTILWLLGIDWTEPMDGRILWEAMKNQEFEVENASERIIQPESLHVGGYNPILRLHKVGNSTYVHEVVNGLEL